VIRGLGWEEGERRMRRDRVWDTVKEVSGMKGVRVCRCDVKRGAEEETDRKEEWEMISAINTHFLTLILNFPSLWEW
jgi:hypothetical protein